MKGVRRNPVRKRRVLRKEHFSLFLLLSFLIHATLILLLALLFAKKTAQKSQTLSEPPPPEVTLEIPPSPKERPFIEAKEIADKPPEKTPFESDQNSKAATEIKPTGSLPLPSQQGITQSALELQTQQHTAGERPASSAGNPGASQPPSPPIPPSPQKFTPPIPQQPTPRPSATPAVTPQKTSMPQPTPTTPPPPNNLRLLEPPKEEPTPTKETAASQQAPQTPPIQARPPSTPGVPGSVKGYRPETRQTVLYGNISNRGRSSIAAQGTPIGRYKKYVSDAIGSRWYYYVNERMGLISIGTVSVSFKVTPSGKVTGLRILSSNGNQSLTDCSLRSIMEAKLPPIPPEVVPTLESGSIEIDFNFTIY
jgi:TonB family protein